MKKLALVFVLIALVLTGCSNKETIKGSDYSRYKCYDTHLFCLDAQDKIGYYSKKLDREWYSFKFRKPVGVSDEQFICARVEHRFSQVDIVVMQNPQNYVDVLQDWTIKEIEIYYISLDYNRIEGASKKIEDEEEPARTPMRIIASTTESLIFEEFKDFVLCPDTVDGVTIRPTWGYNDKGFESEIHESVKVYIRVHFNEAENIVWDSEIRCVIDEENKNRYIRIDKGRSTMGYSMSLEAYVDINEWSNLYQWIEGVMVDFNN